MDLGIFSGLCYCQGYSCNWVWGYWLTETYRCSLGYQLHASKKSYDCREGSPRTDDFITTIIIVNFIYAPSECLGRASWRWSPVTLWSCWHCEELIQHIRPNAIDMQQITDRNKLALSPDLIDTIKIVPQSLYLRACVIGFTAGY